MHFSILNSVQDSSPKRVETTWPDLVDSIRAHVITPDKRSVPLFCPAAFLPGAPRQAEYVESVSFAVLDFDHLNHEGATELMGFLPTLPFRWVLYTTHSHGAPSDGTHNPAGTPEYAYRVLFPFLTPVPGKEWPTLWPKLVDPFILPSGKVRPDKKCSDASRIYYVPSAHPQRESLVQFYERADLPLFDPSPLRMEVRIGASVGQRVTPLPGAVPSGAEPGRKVSRGALEALATRLKRKRNPTGEALSRVLDGVPWAEPGDRDSTLFKLAGDIVSEFPTADMREVAAYFTLSVDRISDPEYTPALVLDKLLRRQAEIQAENARAEAEAEAERETCIRSGFREIGQNREAPYTESEVEVFAAASGVTRTEFQHRWIIQTGGAFYFWFAGSYLGPVKESDGQLAARKYLAPAPIELDSKDAFGRMNPKSIQQLAIQYGTHIRNVVADLNADTCIIDARTSTIVEAPCPIRPLSARFWPEVHTWLELMGGPKHFDILQDWIAWLTDLDRPCTALFLQGAPGAGKSLFAKGLARVWTHGPPSTMEQAFGNWTDAILRCPLVFADERVPKDSRGNARTEDIREFIQQESRPLKRRFCPDAVMRGATRTVIAANNRNLLQSHESNLTVHDIQAIADRIVLIPVGDESARYLHTLGWNGTQHWVNGDRIAEHALWIMENRLKNQNPPRFLVQGTNSNLHMDIAFGTTVGNAVAHWLVAFLDDPTKLWAGKSATHSAFGISYSSDVREGFSPGIVVSAQTMADNWEVYRTNVRPEKATLRTIGMALLSISEGRVTKVFSGNIKRQCARVPLANLIQWGDENGIHADTLTNAVARFQGLLTARGVQ